MNLFIWDGYEVKVHGQEAEEQSIYSLAENKEQAISEVLKKFSNVGDVIIMTKFLNERPCTEIKSPTAFIKKKVPFFLP